MALTARQTTNPDELRVNVSGRSALTGEPFDPDRDAGFFELCVRNDYGRHWRFDRHDADAGEAVFRREAEQDPPSA
ncbi:hypothetical protein [Cellulosimicrobium sp. Marseille-Q4280]|uniref:hypothetical protein n=1 Tax=Cellulosimicrobium sp. Marseille-Q4280 TaxID=2937992 RepID=UPI00203AED0F|nr:hypothetical protein [Cellulosimicrobium sp. Marseille-Q4280]